MELNFQNDELVLHMFCQVVSDNVMVFKYFDVLTFLQKTFESHASKKCAPRASNVAVQPI